MKKLPTPAYEPGDSSAFGGGKEFPEEILSRAKKQLQKEQAQVQALADDKGPATSAASLLKMATGIVQHELSRLQKKAFEKGGLDARDHSSLKLLVGTLTEVTGEERILAKSNDFSKLSDEEIERQAREKLGMKS